jgi:uncharacterized membrane protein
VTQAEVEAQLASLRSEMDQLRAREADRAKASRLIQRIVSGFVVAFALVALGLLAYSWTAGQSPQLAIQLLLLNIPLMFLGMALQIGASPRDAKA